MNTLPIITGLLGLGIAFVLIPLILKLCRHTKWLQRAPDLHHTHKTPIPRFGGIALAAAFLGIEAFLAIFFPEQGDPHQLPIIVGSSLAMFAIGLCDDFGSLGARKKLLAQILIAAVVCNFGVGIETFKIPFSEKIINLGAWGGVITVIWLVSMTNLINLIDGVDGLAGGICLMLMALLAYVGHQSGNLELVASGMVGALLGFLWFNFPPARIYMGDGGAYFLGFQIGLFTIVNSQKGTILPALVAPLFVLALPILDTSLAILRRGLRGLPVFRPDRKHIHHRLIDMGLSRKKVVLSLYAVTLVFLAMGFTAFASRGNLVPALLGIAALVLVLCAGNLRFSREWFAVGRVVENSLNMREDVQYALCLTRWLTLEGSRRKSVEGLWTDLVFLAQRLGFTSVKLTLADGQRTWKQDGSGETTHFARHELQGGIFGVLELKSHSCPADDADSALAFQFPVQVSSETTSSNDVDDANCTAAVQAIGGMEARPAIADAKRFEIVSELLAEGWVKATRKWKKDSHAPLRFDSKVPVKRDEPQPETLNAVPVLQGLSAESQ